MARFGRCPKCGYNGMNRVTHIGTGEIECESCRHDYISGEKSSKKEKDIYTAPLIKPVDRYDMPRTVYVDRQGRTSMFEMPDGELIGHRSGLLLDDDVYSQHGSRIGRIGFNGHLREIKYY